MWELTKLEYRGDHELHEDTNIGTDTLKLVKIKDNQIPPKTPFQARLLFQKIVYLEHSRKMTMRKITG